MFGMQMNKNDNLLFEEKNIIFKSRKLCFLIPHGERYIGKDSKLLHNHIVSKPVFKKL